MSDLITFKSGRSIEPNGGFVGIDPDLEIAEGCDNAPTYWDNEQNEYCDQYSSADMMELADLMIMRWTAFKAKAGAMNLPFREAIK